MKYITKILALFFLLNVSLYANSVGTITALSGSASIERDSKSIDATLGAKLEQKDIIKTSDATKLQIIFSDDTIISIGKNSNFSIDEFLFDESEASSAKFGLLRGAMRTITGKVAELAPDKFSVKTKSATIGIRGTNFSIFTGEDGSAKIFCTFGAISVTAQGSSSVVAQGFYIEVFSDGTRSEPIKFTPQELKEAKEESFASGSEGGSSDPNSQDSDGSEPMADSPIETNNNEDLGLIVEDITDSVADSAQMDFIESLEKEEITVLMTGVGNHSWGYYSSYPYNDEVTLSYSSSGQTLLEASIVDFDNVFWTYNIASTPTRYSSMNDFSYPIESITYSDNTVSNIVLEPTGNYFNAISDLDEDDSMSWGDWGVDFGYTFSNDTTTLTKTGLWIAGEATPASLIEGYKHNNISATYSGIYRANFFTGEKTVEVVDGVATLSVDFGQSDVFLNIGASSRFSEANMQGDIYSGENEFSGGSGDGHFDGVFYGSDGRSAGGNFTLENNGLPTAKGVYQVQTTDF